MEEMNVGMDVVETAAEVLGDEGIEEVVKAGAGFGIKKLAKGLVLVGVLAGATYGVVKLVKAKKAKKNYIDATVVETEAAEETAPEAEVK